MGQPAAPEFHFYLCIFNDLIRPLRFEVGDQHSASPVSYIGQESPD